MGDDDLIFPISLGSLGAHGEEDAGERSGQQQAAGDDSDLDSFFSLEEKKGDSTDKFHQETLLSLMADLSMGYDPSTLPNYAMSFFPPLWDNISPGSFNHLLVILFGSGHDMANCQKSMQSWLDDYLESQPADMRTGEYTLHESLFGSEVEMVRKLASPLRGEITDPVFWLNSRTFYAKEQCEQIEYSIKVVEQLKHDLIASMVVPDEHDPVNGKVTGGRGIDWLWTLRDHRLEASAATLGWKGMPKSGIEFTKFRQYYKPHIFWTNIKKAVELGFWPQTPNKFPSFVLEGLPVTLPKWPCGEAQSMVLDLLFKTALWMGLARGFPALHLFCDMVRHFTFQKPDRGLSPERACFLNHLVRMRVTTRAVRIPQNQPPFPFDDRIYADCNPAYFTDVAGSYHRRTEDLQKTLTLMDKPRVPRNTAVAGFEPKLPPCNPDESSAQGRRNTVAGPRPLDLELKDSITAALLDRYEALSIKTASTGESTASNPIPIPRPNARSDNSNFVDDGVSHYNAW